MQVGLHTLAGEKVAEQPGVRGGDALALQVGHRVIVGPTGHGQTQAALAEAQSFDFEGGTAGFD